MGRVGDGIFNTRGTLHTATLGRRPKNSAQLKKLLHHMEIHLRYRKEAVSVRTSTTQLRIFYMETYIHTADYVCGEHTNLTWRKLDMEIVA